MRITTHRRLSAVAALALGTCALAGAAAVAPQARAADGAGGDLCGITFGSGGVTSGSVKPNADGYYEGSASAELTNWGDAVQVYDPARYGYYIYHTIEMQVPDSCKSGDTAYIDFPNGFHLRGSSSLADVKDEDGNVIATASIASSGTTGRDDAFGVSDTRLVFTLTDYVDTHTGVSGSYTFQVAEGWDTGVDTYGEVATYTLTGSDGSQLNPFDYRLNKGLYYDHYTGGAWSGSSTNTYGYVEARSWASWDGTDDVDMTLSAGAGYTFRCSDLSNTDDSVSVGIGLVDIGFERNSAPTGAQLLDPDSYEVTCTADTITFHMPASSWTSADAESGQMVKILLRRDSDGDMSWQDNGGVIGATSWAQGGHDPDSRTWFNPAPGSSATGSGEALVAITSLTEPTLTDPDCGERAEVVTGSEEGVDYATTYAEDGLSATVTATARKGYYFQAGLVTSWQVDIPQVEACEPVADPTIEPTQEPTAGATEEPSAEPTATATSEPSAEASGTESGPAGPTTTGSLAHTGPAVLVLLGLAGGSLAGGASLLHLRRRG